MKTLQTIVFTILFLLVSNIFFAQDYLAFTALRAEGYGIYAHDLGHEIPIQVCGNDTAYYKLISAEQAPPAEFPGMKAALKLADGGLGFTAFKDTLASYNYNMSQVELKFTLMTLGNDTEFQDWFVIGDTETRFYHNGIYTFYLDGSPLVTGNMPVFQLEIDYQTFNNCFDDVLSSITQYTDVVDASAGQAADVRAIAAALLSDVGNRGIRFVFSQIQPAGAGTTGYVFESATGKIELGEVFDNMGAANVNIPATGTCITPSSTVTSTNSGNWLHILNNGQRVASILDSENMGLITTEFYVNSGAVRTVGTLEYMDRNFTITPAIQPSNPVRVRLYFTATEWQDFVSANPDSLQAMSDITISKFSVSDCDAINNASGEVTLALLDYGYIPTDNSYYLDVEVTSFSTFFVNGPKSSSILPVKLVSFEGKDTKDGVSLKWLTASEQNNDGFEIQKSSDGIDWSRIGWVKGQGTSTISNMYFYNDNSPSVGDLVYYRLKQIDFDGKYSFSPIISISYSQKEENIGLFYPNPSFIKEVKLNYTSPANNVLLISFFDINGKMVLQENKSVVAGFNQLNFDLNALKAGIYLVKINSKQGGFYRKIVLDK